jgi:DNA-binding transcriptional ArsR family regulator
MATTLNENNAELIARRFRALSDPIRLRILNHLRTHEEASVGELAGALGSSQQNISKHLAALHAEGFVARRKQGTSSMHRISDPGVLELCERVCAGIETQLERMGEMIGAGPRSR